MSADSDGCGWNPFESVKKPSRKPARDVSESMIESLAIGTNYDACQRFLGGYFTIESIRDEEAIMPSMEAYASPKKRVIDLPAWTRRDNHEFFRDFLYPNLGVMVRVDAGHAYSAAKERGIPFFPRDFYAI